MSSKEMHAEIWWGNLKGRNSYIKDASIGERILEK